MSTGRDCEASSLITESPCNARAGFLVSRGRKYDAQRSCGRHLAATVTALEEGEGRPVTVEVLRDSGPDGIAQRQAAALLAAALSDPEADL